MEEQKKQAEEEHKRALERQIEEKRTERLAAEQKERELEEKERKEDRGKAHFTPGSDGKSPHPAPQRSPPANALPGPTRELPRSPRSSYGQQAEMRLPKQAEMAEEPRTRETPPKTLALALPPPWEELSDGKGLLWYGNPVTGETRWDRPGPQEPFGGDGRLEARDPSAAPQAVSPNGPQSQQHSPRCEPRTPQPAPQPAYQHGSHHDPRHDPRQAQMSLPGQHQMRFPAGNEVSERPRPLAEEMDSKVGAERPWVSPRVNNQAAVGAEAPAQKFDELELELERIKIEEARLKNEAALLMVRHGKGPKLQSQPLVASVAQAAGLRHMQEGFTNSVSPSQESLSFLPRAAERMQGALAAAADDSGNLGLSGMVPLDATLESDSKLIFPDGHTQEITSRLTASADPDSGRPSTRKGGDSSLKVAKTGSRELLRALKAKKVRAIASASGSKSALDDSGDSGILWSSSSEDGDSKLTSRTESTWAQSIPGSVTELVEGEKLSAAFANRSMSAPSASSKATYGLDGVVPTPPRCRTPFDGLFLGPGS